MPKLNSLFLSGYKSFRFGPPVKRAGQSAEEPLDDHGRRIEFGDVTILLGANGSGKSNVVSFFRMLAFMMTGSLQEHIARAGTADSILHYGAQHTPRMDAVLDFSDDDGGRDTYTLSLASAAPDTLIFANELVESHRHGTSPPYSRSLGAGHKESRLEEDTNAGGPCRLMFDLLRGCRPFHFHDTSDEAKIRKPGYIEDAQELRSDAGNLAAYLLAMKHRNRAYYDRIVRTVRQVCPQFHDFDLAPSERNLNYILLNWRERHHPEYLMGPHQLSDGTLRFMALATLFLQPPEKLPPVAVIDEPELGLHPGALATLAGLIKSASGTTQTILATESSTLVNHFELTQVRPMEHSQGQTRMLELNPDDFAAWMEDYSTGELWEKNVIGGGPRYE